MAHITYMPTAADNDTTVVDGITFTAYVPVDVPDAKAALIDKLSINPWFTAGAPDEERHHAWANARNADLALLKKLESELSK